MNSENKGRKESIEIEALGPEKEGGEEWGKRLSSQEHPCSRTRKVWERGNGGKSGEGREASRSPAIEKEVKLGNAGQSIGQ